MKIVLELLDQTSSVRKITVRHDIVIGRGSDCNLRLSAPQVSRRHCFLRISRDGVSITDLESSNGTWVNGNRLPSSVRHDLTDGAQISLGPVRFVVHVRPEVVPGSILPGGSLNEVITEAAGSPDATTFSGRDAALQHRDPEPRTSSVHALQRLAADSSHAADSRLEIVGARTSTLRHHLASGRCRHPARSSPQRSAPRSQRQRHNRSRYRHPRNGGPRWRRYT
ncbi:MAG UNVERIFIED_CONTAM: FHA domain-containing protein [Planctomycetaceae bacterium]|jgi:pSer/pThr/pTyr-binding forkhead associated (FHA) protein